MTSHWPQIAPDGTIVGKPPRWSAERIARLGYLFGLCKSYAEIADDYIVQSTEEEVKNKCNELGFNDENWTPKRLATLGYLLGHGFDVGEIAICLNLTPNQVHRKANMMHTVFAGVARNK